MRKSILILILLVPLFGTKGKTQSLGYNEFIHLIDLYYDGQFNIVVSKLENLGFEIKNTTPDYEYDDIKYKGHFSMITSRAHPAFDSDMNVTIDNLWQFKTIEYPSYIEYEINFDLEGSYLLFHSIFNRCAGPV